MSPVEVFGRAFCLQNKNGIGIFEEIMRVTTMRKTLTLCLLALALPAGAQSYLDRISDYIENTSVFEENQEPGRAFHLPDQALSLNGT